MKGVYLPELNALFLTIGSVFTKPFLLFITQPILIELLSLSILRLFLTRNESKFLLGGLKVDNKPTWAERQSAYKTAVKAFLIKLNPEFEKIEPKFVRSMRVDPRLFLIVECQSIFE